MVIWDVTPYTFVNGHYDKSNLLPSSSDDGRNRLLGNLGTHARIYAASRLIRT